MLLQALTCYGFTQLKILRFWNRFNHTTLTWGQLAFISEQKTIMFVFSFLFEAFDFCVFYQCTSSTALKTFLKWSGISPSGKNPSGGILDINIARLRDDKVFLCILILTQDAFHVLLVFCLHAFSRTIWLFLIFLCRVIWSVILFRTCCW